MSAISKRLEEMPLSAQIHFVQTTLETELSGKYSSIKERGENIRAAIEVCLRWRANALTKKEAGILLKEILDYRDAACKALSLDVKSTSLNDIEKELKRLEAIDRLHQEKGDLRK